MDRIPGWEAKLRCYISSGDGLRCPLCSRCQVRQGEGWCPSDRVEHLDQLANIDYHCIVISCRIFKLVEMLAQKYLKKGKVHCPPVPTELVSLADEQNPIEVRSVPLTAFHGAIWCLKDSWVIQVNKNDPPATTRFTLFHEAFHILAHRRATPVFRKRGLESGCFNELLAEQFAACILIPAKWVRKEWVKVNDLSKVAKIFDVPKPVACFRLKFLQLI